MGRHLVLCRLAWFHVQLVAAGEVALNSELQALTRSFCLVGCTTMGLHDWVARHSRPRIHQRDANGTPVTCY